MPLFGQCNADMFFNLGSHELRQDEIYKLREIADFLTANHTYSIYLEAYTDTRGDVQSNLALSHRRARAVMDKLKFLGVSDGRIEILAFGEQVAKETSEADMQRNRRVNVRCFNHFDLNERVSRLEMDVEKKIISGMVFDEESGEPLIAKIKVRADHFVDSTMSDAEGQYRIAVPLNRRVNVTASAKGRVFDSKWVETYADLDEPVRLSLPRIEARTEFALDDMYFVADSAILLHSSLPDVMNLYSFMVDNPEARIEIQGHINMPFSPDVDTNSTEFWLSEERARVVYNILVSNGIDRNRIAFVGRGNHEMVFPLANTPEEEKKNRRVEVKILSN